MIASVKSPQTSDSAGQEKYVTELIHAVLTGVETISGYVGKQLGSSSPAPAHALPQLKKRISEQRLSQEALRKEPAIARVDVEWQDSGKVETYLICRGSAAGMQSPELKATLVSYRTPLGRLAELPPGEDATVNFPIGMVGEYARDGYIRTRAQFTPCYSNGVWDGLDSQLEGLTFSPLYPASLRALLKEWDRRGNSESTPDDILSTLLDGNGEKLEALRTRHRQTIEHMTLRDRAILDPRQGLVFRLPLQHQLILFGPPGTGKTTTLIKRLAQKRTKEALAKDEIEQLQTAGVEDIFFDDVSWVMFSPTELLKLYVRESFNREGVPASSVNLRTWETQREELAKQSLAILRPAGNFYLTTEENTLSAVDSRSLSALHDAFAQYVDEAEAARFREAAEWLLANRTSLAVEVRQAVLRLDLTRLTADDIYRFSQRARDWTDVRRRIDAAGSGLQHTLVNRIITANQSGWLSSFREFLKPFGKDEDDEELENESKAVPGGEQEEVRLAKELMKWVARLAEASFASRRSAALKAFAAWLGGDDAYAEEFRALGLQLTEKKKLKILIEAPRVLVTAVPGFYRKFRRENLAKGIWYRDKIDSNAISPLETDVLILLMLSNARRARSYGEPPWLNKITDQYRMQVYVDEATDFSAVQLAAMLELSHPSLRSWFACGDFRQRMTGHGIASGAELEWIRSVTRLREPVSEYEITHTYRQTARLQEFATALSDGRVLPSPASGAADHYTPQLVEKADLDQAAAWLVERITEVESIIGKLPSAAIFVDREEQLDPLVNRLRPLLVPHSLKVAACRDGNALGTEQQVRVFDVQHVKGLEFEAVFFVGVDRMRERIPELFDRYLYVGVTRAATFLGLTCEAALPAELDYLRPLLGSGGWRS